MPKSTLSPLADLASAIPADVTVISPGEQQVLCDGFYDLLLGEHLCCNGSSLGHERDPQWTRDIHQLVERAQTHNIYSQNEAGVWVAASVSLKLATIRCEVDSNSEICCWIYEES